MTIEIHQKPHDRLDIIAERCVFCSNKTLYLAKDKYNPVCQPCALIHHNYELKQLDKYVLMLVI